MDKFEISGSNKAINKVASPRRFRINPGYLFLAPAMILIIAITIYPTFSLFDMSVHELNRRTSENVFVGFKNFQLVIQDPIFIQAFKQTLFFTGIGAIGHIGIGTLLALLMNSELNRKVIGISRSLILLPWVLSPTVVAVLLQLWGNPLISPIAKVLQALGWTGSFQPLGNVSTALISLVIVNVWQYTPFYMLMILCGLQSMDPELHAAGKVDGANNFQRLIYITWPHIRNTVLTFTLFDLVTNAGYFDLIWVATQGGPIRSTEVLSTYIYRIAFQSLNWNYSSVVGVALLLFSILLSVFVILRMRRD